MVMSNTGITLGSWNTRWRCVKTWQSAGDSFGMPALVRVGGSPLCRLNSILGKSAGSATVTMAAGAEAEMAVPKFQFEPSVFLFVSGCEFVLRFVLGNLVGMKKKA
jgi:hypothetical protein